MDADQESVPGGGVSEHWQCAGTRDARDTAPGWSVFVGTGRILDDETPQLARGTHEPHAAGRLVSTGCATGGLPMRHGGGTSESHVVRADRRGRGKEKYI